MLKWFMRAWRTCQQCNGGGCKWCNWKGGIEI